MDIHRCRFVNYTPSAINALAFSHTSGSAGRDQPLRLAIGRANGDIEIWDPRRGAWIHEITLRSGKDRSVEGLAWTHDPDEEDEKGYVTHGRLRLFSIGYSSAVTEWDLNTGLPLQHSTGSHSEVWCLAAQPRWKAKKQVGDVKEDSAEFRGQNLVAGCADGTLVLLSTADDGLTFQKYIARASKKNARALSLTFQNRNVVVAGFADSAIRVFDIRNGNLLRNMSLGGGPQGGPKEKLVWAIECLRDGTLVSGDSTGEVIFWDGNTYGQLQRIKSHDADVLCLTASEDGQTVFSGGMDTRTVVYKLTGGQSQRKRWAAISKRSFHQHDVKAMARFENSKMSVVVSGGLDTHPILIPLRDFGDENFRHLPYTPQKAPVAAAGRLVVSWWDNEITLWRVNSHREDSVQTDFLEPRPNYQVAAQLALKGDESISTASISTCGSLLVVATAVETKVFHLQARSTEQDGPLKINKLDLPAALAASAARLVQFSSDSKWLLAIGLTNTIHLWRITSSDASDELPSFLPTPSVLPRLPRSPMRQSCLNGSWGSYDRTINHAAFSSDSRILAVSDLSGHIDTWILEGNEDVAAPDVDIASRGSSRSPSLDDADSDSDDEEDDGKRTVVIYGQHWARNPLAHMLPRLPSAALILSFRPLSESAMAQKSAKINGNPAVHATRNNPHAHSHALPLDSEDRLFIVTAVHEVYEFEVLRGRLSDWSRRNNGVEALPEGFRIQRERTVGCVWDISADNSKQRIWLHGATWLCMFDLAQDFLRSKTSPPKVGLTNGVSSDVNTTDDNNNSSSSKKRKRPTKPTPTTDTKSAVHSDLILKRNTSGLAGSRITSDTPAGRVKVRRVDKDGNEEWIESDVAKQPGARKPQTTHDDEANDEDSDEDDESGDADGHATTTDAAVETALSFSRRKPDHSKSNGTPRAASFWLTNRYRPILGIVPLCGGSGSRQGGEEVGVMAAGEGEGVGLEVALIERPFWDLDLPPRFELGRKGR